MGLSRGMFGEESAKALPEKVIAAQKTTKISLKQFIENPKYKAISTGMKGMKGIEAKILENTFQT